MSNFHGYVSACSHAITIFNCAGIKLLLLTVKPIFNIYCALGTNAMYPHSSLQEAVKRLK